MTKVLNLYGGSGLGKSTTAAGLFYEMKLRGYHCELVREYVKNWAWEGRKITKEDQPHIFEMQAKSENMLYGKVDLIVTDSPLLLSPIYESFYTGDSSVLKTAQAFLTAAKNSGIEYHNFILQRHKPFDTRGRYETVEMAKEVDEYVKKMLNLWEIPYTMIESPDRERVNTILSSLGL